MAPNRFNPDKDLNDLTGKVALVTGATSGLGYAVALELLRKGATVYLAARSESKAVATIGRLEADGLEPGNGKPIFHKLDLEDPYDVKKSAEEFLARESRLDILINNAACLGKEYAMGPIGVQDMVTINHISPFLFTELVLPLMKKTAHGDPDADVRIVNVASNSHKLISVARFKEKADLNGPTTSNSYWAQLKRYAYTKLLNILWTRELARKLMRSFEDGGNKILCTAVEPGPVSSEGVFNAVAKLPWPLSVIGRWITLLFFTPPKDAAATVLIAAASPQPREGAHNYYNYHGGYLMPVGRLAETSELAADEGKMLSLWVLTEKILVDEGLLTRVRR